MTLTSGLRPASGRMTHNHVTIHVAGMFLTSSLFVLIADLAHARKNRLYEPHRGIACSRPHVPRTTECDHIFAASLIGTLLDR